MKLFSLHCSVCIGQFALVGEKNPPQNCFSILVKSETYQAEPTSLFNLSFYFPSCTVGYIPFQGIKHSGTLNSSTLPCATQSILMESAINSQIMKNQAEKIPC
jgi:hypothetical protein